MYDTTTTTTNTQKDQMRVASDIFKYADEMSKAEKSLILGFIAGSRG